jgi:hypothetical protein
MSAAPPGFARRVVTIEPGGVLAYDEAAWLDAIVVVEDGDVVLECVSGGSRRFRRGDILWLAGLPLRCVRNPGGIRTRLLAVSRDKIGGWPGPPPSSPPPGWVSPSSSSGPSPPS